MPAMDTRTPDPAAAGDNTSAAAADTGGMTGIPSAREAAAALDLSERTVRRAIQRGDLVARKHAGWYRIPPAALEADRPPFRRAGCGGDHAGDAGADLRRTPSAAGCGRPPPRGGAPW